MLTITIYVSYYRKARAEQKKIREWYASWREPDKLQTLNFPLDVADAHTNIPGQGSGGIWFEHPKHHRLPENKIHEIAAWVKSELDRIGLSKSIGAHVRVTNSSDWYRNRFLYVRGAYDLQGDRNMDSLRHTESFVIEINREENEI